MVSNKQGCVVWFTGLPGAGKTTIADAVADKLAGLGVDCERLDGDIVRQHLTKDLGFSREDRAENLSRAGFVSGLLSKHGVVVIASFVSPYRQERDMVRGMVTNFLEVYMATSLEICERRDPKGLYAQARKGEINNFTGVSDPYEAPINPDLSIIGDREVAEITQLADKVIQLLKARGLLSFQVKEVTHVES